MSETDDFSNLSESEDLADTESYRELLKDTGTMKLLEKEIQDLIDLRLQEIGISPEWKGIPRKTYEKSMEIVEHQNKLLKKTIPKFDTIKKKLDAQVNKKCDEHKENRKGKSKAENESRDSKMGKNKHKIQEKINTRQNIVKIICKPKPRPRKTKEKLTLPPSRRNSVTISNPVLFETQDSSTDSDSFVPENSMNKVIAELKSNLRHRNDEETNSGGSDTKLNETSKGSSKETNDFGSARINERTVLSNKSVRNQKSEVFLKGNYSEGSTSKKSLSSSKKRTLKKKVLDESDSDCENNSTISRYKNIGNSSLKTNAKSTSRIKFEDLSTSESSENDFNYKSTPLEQYYSSTLNKSKTTEQIVNDKIPRQTDIKDNSKDDNIFESSGDENIVRMFKTAENLKEKESQSLNQTKITQVLPKSNKNQKTKMGSRVKHVLFDIDND